MEENRKKVLYAPSIGKNDIYWPQTPAYKPAKPAKFSGLSDGAAKNQSKRNRN